MNQYRILDLFSGIGGFSLGLERVPGFETVAFCEQDGYARRVLRKHWPDVWLYEDVRTLNRKRLKADGLDPNVVVGGFPCQDISTAGKGKGLEGERSGLWSEMLRLIKEIKPLWVIAENVPALRGRGADRVLADLEGAGYAATPVVVGAVHVGANHRRDRVWIVAYTASAGREAFLRECGKSDRSGPSTSVDPCCPTVSHPHGLDGGSVQRADNKPRHNQAISRDGGYSPWWQVEPAVGRVVDALSAGLDRSNRLRCLGNAVVPLIPQLIGEAIVDYTSPARTQAAA